MAQSQNHDTKLQCDSQFLSVGLRAKKKIFINLQKGRCYP